MRHPSKPTHKNIPINFGPLTKRLFVACLAIFGASDGCNYYADLQALKLGVVRPSLTFSHPHRYKGRLLYVDSTTALVGSIGGWLLVAYVAVFFVTFLLIWWPVLKDFTSKFRWP